LGTCYAKLLVANVDDVRSIVINEKKELELALKQEGESVSFICLLFMKRLTTDWQYSTD
jgi:hypothetical protein